MAGDHRSRRLSVRRSVSIHARAWRATRDPRGGHHSCARFNPRPRMAGDASVGIAKGGQQLFQSTTAHGGRPNDFGGEGWCIPFQSTPAHGGRRVGSTSPPRCGLFQSTPAHGGRRSLVSAMRREHLFQSTPAHGGRLCRPIGTSAMSCFNPRPRMAGDVK